MDRLEAMRVFVAVAEMRGFTPAARRLTMSPAAATRAVSALEERLGTRLLRRTTRVVRLTDAGARYLADCKRILGDIEEAEAGAAGTEGEPRGMLNVTAPVNFGRMFVAPTVLGFLERHPRISVRMLLVDHVVHLIEEGMDVGIRIAHLRDSALRAVRVGTVRRVVCAAPEYLVKRGTPRTPSDLIHHDTIGFSNINPTRHWSFSTGSKTEAAETETRLFVNTADVAIAAAKAGHGLTRVLSYQVDPDVRTGQLRVVLEDFEPPEVPIHIVYPDARRATSSVRAFVDYATERLRTMAQSGAFGTKFSKTR
ncbi:LysR family transcriptional regulator [Pendulispora rubella]|uniref:LysR family transcriptional regulator n=1 Tax=Pendulispora rubella TaxID=2741070 RepID=A0ABZ2KUY3_9BACT